MFSTITSPVFFELVIVVTYRGVKNLPQGAKLLETLRETNEKRPFKLEFSFAVTDLLWEEERRELARSSDAMAVKSCVDFLDSPPTIR